MLPARRDTTFSLHYVGTADGVVRYRWNGGGWSANLNVQGADNQASVGLAGKPAGAWALEVEVVSGTVKLCGLVASRAGNGVIVHKLAGTGSHTYNWAVQDAERWKAGYAAWACPTCCFDVGYERSAWILPPTTRPI